MSSQDYQAQAQASSFSYTYSSNSSSSTSNGETHTTGSRAAQQSYTDAAGATTTESLTQNYGEPAVQEIRRFGPDGREMPSVEGGEAAGRRSLEGTAGTGNNRVEDVGESEEDRQYRERMEEEYAKREGGA